MTTPHYLRLLSRLGLVPLAFILSLQAADAGSATWTGSDDTSIWEYGSNWNPATVPGTAQDVATFDGVSHITLVAIGSSQYPQPGTLLFNPGASAYTIVVEGAGASFTKRGVVNKSGVTQAFTIYGPLHLTGSASAGNGTIFTSLNSLEFEGNSTAGNSTCIADNEITSGTIIFSQYATGGHATLIAYGGDHPGYIFFRDHSQASNARVVLQGDEDGSTSGQLELLNRDSLSRDVAIGSLEGIGNVTLAGEYSPFAANLIVGSNNVSTTFGGVIWYSYYFQNDGAITKVGSGTLTLTGANEHRGGTTVQGGRLLIDNTTGSGTGAGPVTVQAGTLGGTGTIAGAVTVGDGLGRDAFLVPGDSLNPVTPLTIQSSLAFRSDAALRGVVDSGNSTAASIVAYGVQIHGALILMSDLAESVLPPGTILTIINNSAPTGIVGTFRNLVDGGTITVGSNTFQANYEGGDGNDLTLTVVP